MKKNLGLITDGSSDAIATTKVRVLAFALSSGIAGLAGALYRHYLMLISPEMGSLAQMFLILAMTMIGGLGTIAGPIVGAAVLEVLSEQIRSFGEYHILVFGVIALFMVRFAPEGIMDLKRRLK